MKITIAAIGRMKSGPELMLVNHYLDRAAPVGRRLAIGPFTVTEVDERRARDQATQSARLIAAIPEAAFAVALDERGATIASPELAGMLADQRDRGAAAMVFLVGGADGHDDWLRARADRVLSLGPMVWPHMLVRVMMAEQLYRAVSILAGTPYHRA